MVFRQNEYLKKNYYMNVRIGDKKGRIGNIYANGKKLQNSKYNI